MAVFEYSAVDVDSAAVAGTVIADSPLAARDILRDRGLTITDVRPAREERKSSLFFRRRGGGARPEVVSFVRELATLLRAGITLLAALHTLADQYRGRFRAVIQRLADQVSAGVSLADAMANQPLYFDELCVSIVRVGDSTGSLETALSRLAEFKEKSHRLRGRLVTALIYPAVVSSVGLLVCVFLMTFVVPNLLGTLAQAKKDLPAVTRFVKGTSDILLDRWWAILAAFGAAAILLRLLLSTERGKFLADKAILAVPMIGDLVRKENTSRIAVILAALLRGGLQFVEAVGITRGVIRNRVFRSALDDYEKAVAAGKDVSGPLKAGGVFPPMVVQMLAVGQQSGELEAMLEELSIAYDHQIATAATRLTAVLEPILIMVLASMVGFIAFATIMPILEISNAI
jgi:general secretion pathway protein F